MMSFLNNVTAMLRVFFALRDSYVCVYVCKIYMKLICCYNVMYIDVHLCINQVTNSNVLLDIVEADEIFI